MSVVRFIADLHLGHINMALKRGFNTVEDHDNHIIQCWNSVVSKRDTVFLVGDITMESSEHYYKLDYLNGIKKVILGNHDKPQHIPELLSLFAKTGLEVCEGQQMDMNFETQEKVSVHDYIDMITFKTAVLLGCSLQMGAICANASIENQKHVYEFGKHVGIAFQILDDVLDVYADDEKFGKQVGGDIISNKKTKFLDGTFGLVYFANNFN